MSLGAEAGADSAMNSSSEAPVVLDMVGHHSEGGEDCFMLNKLKRKARKCKHHNKVLRKTLFLSF